MKHVAIAAFFARCQADTLMDQGNSMVHVEDFRQSTRMP